MTKFILKPHNFLLLLLTIFLMSCGYPLQYPLTPTNAYIASNSRPFKVAVAKFVDKRNEAERDRNARKLKGDKDISDYTYDKEFKGKVDEEITKMIVKHLNYSRVFLSPVEPASFTSDEISAEQLSALRNSGVDAVLAGQITHFYGYYDNNIGRQLLYELPLGLASGLLLSWNTSNGIYKTTYYWYGPGLVLGAYLESLHKRKVEQHTQIDARLISTADRHIIWQDSIEVFKSEVKSIPGLSQEKEKFKLALSSFRQAVNKMAEELSEVPVESAAVPRENIPLKEDQETN